MRVYVLIHSKDDPEDSEGSQVGVREEKKGILKEQKE
jgi:hypothetical protein